MDIVNSILGFIVSVLDTVLPALGVPDEFFLMADSAISTLIGIIQVASFFIPLDIFVLCFTVMLIVDNFAILMRIGQFILKLVRG